MAGCTRPLLAVDAGVPTAQVTFKNNSSGYLQQFFFEDPVLCQGAQLIDYSLNPYRSTEHLIPAERTITIGTSGFGLPADPGKISWCRPAAFSTKLEAGRTYVISFELDLERKRCGTVLLDGSGRLAPRVDRHVAGPEIGGGGVLSGSFSCNGDDDLSAL